MMLNEGRAENKDDSLSKEEECDYFRQRCNVLKAVKDKYQQELISYKMKVQGVDSIMHLLKESRQEIENLHKCKKSLESAVNNLQRRLCKNGLSNSPTLQDCEVFVPGASKQTLDNLAKENVRLRNLLKSGNGQLERKSTDELDELKASKDKLESENSVLKREIQSYEDKFTALTKEKEEEKALFEQDRTQLEENKKCQDFNEETSNRVSIGCQTSDLKADTILELRESLKQCSNLVEHLYQSQEIVSSVENDKIIESNLKTPILVDEDYTKLQRELDEAILNNQRWHAYSQNQDFRIQSLTQTNSALKKAQEVNLRSHQEMIDRLKSKELECQECQEKMKRLEEQLKQLQHYRLEVGNVEILKQQIQVCTEDFNTERKDREQAVNRAKALQDENAKLKNEVDRLKILNNTELMSRFQQPQLQPLQQQQQQQPHAQFSQVPRRHYELVHEGRPRPNVAMRQPLGSPGMSLPHHVMAETASLSPRMPISDYNSMRFRNIVADGTLPQKPVSVESHSLPREVLKYSNVDVGSSTDTDNRMKNNSSMPTLNRRGSGPTGQLLACPKCNKEFSDNCSIDLLTHIDMCTA